MGNVVVSPGRHALCLAALAATLLGCGPSLRSVHEGARYFERCYAADLDPAFSAEAKLACWERWLSYYARSQPPERVTYARLRQVAIAQGEELPPLDTLHSERVDDSSPPEAPKEALHEVNVAMKGPCAPTCRQALLRCAQRCSRRDDSCLRTCRSRAAQCLGACP